MKLIFETERLILREFETTDAENLYKLNSDHEVIKFTGNKPFKSIIEVREFVQNYRDYKRNGFGRWSVILKENLNFIGWCGLKLNDDGIIDIGFRFFRSEWNKGYATESAIATLKYGFETLKLKEIIGRASTENRSSIRVLEKIGMKYWKTENYDKIGSTCFYKKEATDV